ncbi:MAG: AbrB/MazE/SpoVT family DNA-binding domain-containing protein [Patescibacteria group bacterium]
MNQIITIRDRRQITIPRIFLTKFGLDVGDKLIVKLQGNEMKIEPLKSNTVDLLTKIHEIIKDSGISEKEIQASARALRKKLVKKYNLI